MGSGFEVLGLGERFHGQEFRFRVQGINFGFRFQDSTHNIILV
jgi:hypothetical protein